MTILRRPQVPYWVITHQVTQRSKPVFLKVGGIAPLGAILMDKGVKKKQRGQQGGKKTPRGPNAQPLIDD